MPWVWYFGCSGGFLGLSVWWGFGCSFVWMFHFVGLFVLWVYIGNVVYIVVWVGVAVVYIVVWVGVNSGGFYGLL